LGKISADITETNFVLHNSIHYELSILQRMDSFAYMVTDGRQQILALREYQLEGENDSARMDEVNAIVAADPQLQAKYRRVRVGLVNPKHTLVPNRLFNPQEKAVYLAQVARMEADAEIFVDDISAISAQNVHYFPEDIARFYRERFPGCRLFNCASAFIAAQRPMSSHQSGPQLFLQYWTGCLQVILFHGRDLLFINTFPVHSDKDLAYFALLPLDQFQLSPQETAVHIAGQFLSDAPLLSQLSRFVGRVNLLEPPAMVRLGPRLAQELGRRHYDLFILPLYH
jgi:hypothetical protein